MNNAAPMATGPIRSVQVQIAGEAAICDPRGVLFLPAMRMLIVSDLHLEKGSSLARRGIMAPPYDTAATLQRLAGVLDHYRPDIVVSLGDSFHDRQASARLPAIYRDTLVAMMAGRDWYWIAGNHDPDAHEELPGQCVEELSVGNLLFRHEPEPGCVDGEIAGHLHPGARLVRRGRSIRRACFASDGRRMIMPAFGAYTGALNILDGAYAGLFEAERLTAYMLGSNHIYPIAGTMLSAG